MSHSCQAPQKLNLKYFSPIGLSILLFFGGVSFSDVSHATSKPYDIEAEVTLKDGDPCFFLPVKNSNTPSPYGQTLIVKINRGAQVWRMDESRGLMPLPTGEARCLKYGVKWSEGKVTIEPLPLQYDVPYFVYIEADYKYQAPFCLAKKNGETVLTKWAEDGDSCTDKPLNDTDKSSMWKSIFGK